MRRFSDHKKLRGQVGPLNLLHWLAFEEMQPITLTKSIFSLPSTGFRFYFIQNISAKHTFKSIKNSCSTNSLMMPINLVQYRRPLAMFKNLHFASMTLKVFSKDKISVGIL